jgi:hypothetical protein
MEKINIYLDDVRIPQTPEVKWHLVKNYDQFVNLVESVGLEGIEVITLDHDLGPESMHEYFTNVSPNYKLEYENISEKTGYDCAKYLVNKFYDQHPERIEMDRRQKKTAEAYFPTVLCHSANPIGSANIMGYINNFLMNEGRNQNCIRVHWDHTIEE